MIYDYTDKLYKKYSLFIVRAFNSLNRELQGLNFDELNTAKSYKSINEKVRATYKKVYDELIEVLILMVVHSFKESCNTVLKTEGAVITYYTGKKDGFRKEHTFDATLFVALFLDESDYVTKYVFNNEYERKIARTVEALLTSSSKADIQQELKKALRYWNTQAKQTGDDLTMDGYIEGFKAVGISKVKWVTQEDIKVCAGCAERDGRIYDIDKIEIPLHYNCRCYFVPV